jgi:hypothetical protein
VCTRDAEVLSGQGRREHMHIQKIAVFIECMKVPLKVWAKSTQLRWVHLLHV